MGYDRWFISIPVSRVLHPPRLTPSRLVATSLIAFSNYRPPSLPTILFPPFQIDKKIESPYRGNEFQKFDPFISSHFFFPLPFLSLLLFFFSSPLYFIFRFCFFFCFPSSFFPTRLKTTRVSQTVDRTSRRTETWRARFVSLVFYTCTVSYRKRDYLWRSP